MRTISQSNSLRISRSARLETKTLRNGFSVVDVVRALTNSADPLAYWQKLKQRLKGGENETVTNCHALKMTAADGKHRLTDVATTKQLLRII